MTQQTTGFVCPGEGCPNHMNGCVNGVAIDIDEFTEGYASDVAYPLAPCHPHYCRTCSGTGARELRDGSTVDCGRCKGRGVTRGHNDCQERLAAVVEQAEGDARHEKREAVAQAIFDSPAFYGSDPRKPAWVPGGNSDRQDEARRLADVAMRAMEATHAE